ncbi:BQ5605_C002g01225 [Microbotryum silenes-dioicae]|uniref:BQ5605_C002g01225 protein n=1 Tax=Microbotryum silenes-dioicae TaxID=796604 RepID=A0A2X0MK20_9BASI|nr:BQ5605_C002g01225 [Microbotryum silenes-dioicae]
MSIMMRALTSDDDHEILECLDMSKQCTAGTGLMHESYQKDDPRRYTRSWFAWANGLFGELILDVWESLVGGGSELSEIGRNWWKPVVLFFPSRHASPKRDKRESRRPALVRSPLVPLRITQNVSLFGSPTHF